MISVAQSRPEPTKLLPVGGFEPPGDADEASLFASLFQRIEAVLGGVPNPSVFFFEKTFEQRNVFAGPEFTEHRH